MNNDYTQLAFLTFILLGLFIMILSVGYKKTGFLVLGSIIFVVGIIFLKTSPPTKKLVAQSVTQEASSTNQTQSSPRGR